MLPDTADPPTALAKATEISLIAGAIRPQFFTPESGQLVFPCRQSPAVPEIPIYKNRDAMRRENDIRASRKRSIITSVSKPHSSQFLLNKAL
jgi:hypothetical protein